MTEWNEEERKIRETLDSLKIEKPPASLMKDYEDEVMGKVTQESGSPVPGMVIAFSFVIALAVVGLFMWIQRPVPERVPALRQGVSSDEIVEIKKTVQPERMVSSSEPATDAGEEEFEELSRELLLLEMLGEDEGLLDDLKRMESDREWMETAGIAVFSGAAG